MKEVLIKVETARLARENGFDWICSGNYDANQPEILCPTGWITNWNNKSYSTISAPTQSLLQKWFRDVHNIYANVASKL
jgi:hypothetical protein